MDELSKATFYKNLGQRIANRRKELSLTQESLADKTDLTRASIANIEVGRQHITIPSLYQIADALDCDPISLVPGGLKSIHKGDEFSFRLKYVRSVVRKVSQKILAEEVGLPPSQISHFETSNRKPSFENLVNISKALNVSCDYLVGLSDEFDGSGRKDPILVALNQLNDENKLQAEQFIKFLYMRQS